MKNGQILLYFHFNKIIKEPGTSFQSPATCPNYSITRYAKIPVFHFFEKVNKGQLKMVFFNHEKWTDLAVFSF